ncbi:transition state regulatory protein AbrB (plasmid) [Paenibacillus larvae subsp. larvae]|uniref:Transition state regulatory protein AbrB n=2 Tax=Paenibacillus larvae TaxID=1464 RepID=A0A6C0QZL9_9BACL|nr:transition state regulatory protein AbrB [Paenibacillus larvae subsp. larvae]
MNSNITGMIRNLDPLGRIVLPKEMRKVLALEMEIIMNSNITGMIRNLDPLGRIVLPKEMRKVLALEVGDPYSLYPTDRGIIVRKFSVHACIFCGKEDDSNIIFSGSKVCRDCMESLPQPDPETKMRRSVKSNKTLEKLLMLYRLMQKYPKATQTELAEKMGITQSRVNQLKKMIESFYDE